MRIEYLILILFLVILSGCSYDTNTYGSTNSNPAKTDGAIQDNNNVNTDSGISDIETININGINEVQEINSAKSVVLRVNGQNHQITVLRGTNVTSMDVNGQNIIINLPKETQPIIRKNGINVSIIYY